MWHWKRFPSKAWLAIPLLPTLLLAVACGTAATPAPRAAPIAAPPAPVAAPTLTPIPAPVATVHPGKLTVLVGGLANERFDFNLASGPGDRNYGRTMGGFLISENERKEMVPGIASRWDLSHDGLTWTFTIRKGVKFHDGSELTPEDVLWTLQHAFGPQAPEYSSGGTVGRISRATDRIELSGPDKVSLTTKRPLPDFAITLSEAGDKWFHIMPKRAKAHDIEEEAAYDKRPIGAGVVRVDKLVPASLMGFERFDDYYYQLKNGFPEDKRVNFQSLDMFLVPEEATRVAALRAGEADLIPASLATLKQVEAGGGRVVFGQEGVVLEAKLLGCWEPQYPCHDKRVRQALDYAIDKGLIRDRLYGGSQLFQAKGWGQVTPSTIGYTPELDPRPFDPGKARQLLADAGYPSGKGFGKLLVNSEPSTSMPYMVESAQLAVEFWRRELGIDAQVKVVDTTAVRKAEEAGALKGEVLWREDTTRVDATSGTGSSYGDPKGLSRVHEDPELFRLVQENDRVLEPDKRAEASRKLYLRLRDENYAMGIGYANIPWGVGPRVLTWRPYSLAGWPSALHTITLK